MHKPKTSQMMSPWLMILCKNWNLMIGLEQLWVIYEELQFKSGETNFCFRRPILHLRKIMYCSLFSMANK
jgi:hypothetical protein